MKAIVAMSNNRAIGKNKGLPWPIIKEDFQFFKDFTTNKILVVGNKTFSTIPPLRNRNIIILTNNSISYEDGYDPIYNYGYCYKSYKTILDIDEHHKNNLICIGGAKTYELFLPFITELYVTHINGTYDADTFMPPFEHLFSKKEIIRAFNKYIVMYPSLNTSGINPDSLKEFDGHKVIRYSKG